MTDELFKKVHQFAESIKPVTDLSERELAIRGAALAEAAEAVGAVYQCSDSWDAVLNAAIKRIRSLDPDAAQALAAHDAGVERRARLDEHLQSCTFCKDRIGFCERAMELSNEKT